MFHSTNSNVPGANFCDVCILFFETKNGLYKHQSYDTKQKELLEKIFDSVEDEDLTHTTSKVESSAKTIERMYDSDGDFININPITKAKTKTKFQTETKDNTKDIVKTITKDTSKTIPEDNIYTRFKYEYKECHEEFRKKHLKLLTHIVMIASI